MAPGQRVRDKATGLVGRIVMVLPTAKQVLVEFVADACVIVGEDEIEPI